MRSINKQIQGEELFVGIGAGPKKLDNVLSSESIRK